jgi:hypothetical protein
MWNYRSAWLDVIRTKLAGLIITTPNPLSLVKPIRESPGIRYGKVIKTSGKDKQRIVKIYSREWYPNGVIIPHVEFYDSFKAWLPDDIYERYMSLRKKFYVEAHRRLMEYIRKKQSTPPTA